MERPTFERSRRRIRTAARLAVCLALLVVAAASGAEEKKGSAPESRAILKQMSGVLQSAKQLSFHAEVNFDESPIPGPLVQLAGAMDVALRRPDGLRVQYRDDLGARTLWYDGKSVTVLDWNAGVVASAPAPQDVDRALAQFEQRYALTFPLGELLSADPHRSLLAGAVRGTYLGIHDVESVSCHHLAAVRGSADATDARCEAVGQHLQARRSAGGDRGGFDRGGGGFGGGEGSGRGAGAEGRSAGGMQDRSGGARSTAASTPTRSPFVPGSTRR